MALQRYGLHIFLHGTDCGWNNTIDAGIQPSSYRVSMPSTRISVLNTQTISAGEANIYGVHAADLEVPFALRSYTDFTTTAVDLKHHELDMYSDIAGDWHVLLHLLP